MFTFKDKLIFSSVLSCISIKGFMNVFYFKIKYVVLRFGLLAHVILFSHVCIADADLPERMRKSKVDNNIPSVIDVRSENIAKTLLVDTPIEELYRNVYAGSFGNTDNNRESQIAKDEAKVSNIAIKVKGTFCSQKKEAVSQSSVMIYGIKTDFRLIDKGKAQYNELLNTLTAEGLEFRMRIRSMRRSLRSFANNTSSCIFPANKKIINSARSGKAPQSLIVSAPVDVLNVKVFSGSDQPVFSSITELEGKRIAYWGKPVLNFLLNDINFLEEPTHNESVRLKMLNAGRIDAVVAPDKDVYITAKKLGIPLPGFDPKLTVWSNLGSSLVCHDTPQNRAFLDEVNGVLWQLNLDGRLESILGWEGMPPVF